ncbi:MAG: response regulator, partial [Dehalococcoidales bacterium]
VHQESPDLVIVDVMMPNLDGIEISLRVRTCSKAPIIILSAWETGQSSVRLFDLTAESYLSKPMDIYEVIALVECALRNNRAVPAIKPSQDRHRALSPEPCLVKTGTTLKIVCAWCGRYIGEKDGYGVKGISHGICKQCEARLEAETQNMVTEHY